jgi:putative transposase
MIDAIQQTRSKHDLDLWAYVVMPEHVHLLVWPRFPNYSISRILTTLKQSVSETALRFVEDHAPTFLKHMADVQPNGRTHYRFWQRGGGFDRNLFEPNAIWSEIEYMHSNPVRRSLCERATDWVWSSAIEYAYPGKGLLTIDRGSLPRTVKG